MADTGDVGSKVLFMITQGLAIGAMTASRRLAQAAEQKAMENSYRMAEFGCGADVVGATVGSPVVGPAVSELRQMVESLQQQVQELHRRQEMLERKEQVQQMQQMQPMPLADDTQELI